jgi:hypothetical protein
MELVNLFNGNVVHASLNCLNVTGNTATMSGNVTYTNNPLLTTFSAVNFSVQDNGDSASAPRDLISFTFFDQPSPDFTCLTTFFAPDMPIIGGNVRVSG